MILGCTKCREFHKRNTSDWHDADKFAGSLRLVLDSTIPHSS